MPRYQKIQKKQVSQMLILTRKLGEEILIGDDIRIKILDSTRYSVRIGIEAPEEVIILRSELINLNEEQDLGKETTKQHRHKINGNR